MKNIIITFFKVIGLTMITGLFMLFILILLFNDVLVMLDSILLLILLLIFLGGFTVFMSFLIMYLPLYYLNKQTFEQKNVNLLFDQFLPIVIIPLTTTALIFMITSPHDLFDADVMLAFMMGYLITYFSFYHFIKFIKK